MLSLVSPAQAQGIKPTDDVKVDFFPVLPATGLPPRTMVTATTTVYFYRDNKTALYIATPPATENRPALVNGSASMTAPKSYTTTMPFATVLTTTTTEYAMVALNITALFPNRTALASNRTTLTITAPEQTSKTPTTLLVVTVPIYGKPFPIVVPVIPKPGNTTMAGQYHTIHTVPTIIPLPAISTPFGNSTSTANNITTQH